MNSEGKVAAIIAGVVWGIFAIFLLGLALSSWLRHRHRRKHKGHRHRHREWN